MKDAEDIANDITVEECDICHKYVRVATFPEGSFHATDVCLACMRPAYERLTALEAEANNSD